MIIELLVDTANHKAGTKLDIDADYAIRMIRNGQARKYVVATDVPFEPVKEDPDQTTTIEAQITKQTVEPKVKKVPKKAPKKKVGRKPAANKK